jgi:hypothetical protein
MKLSEAVNSGKPFKRPNWKKSPNGEQPWVFVANETTGYLKFLDGWREWNPRQEDIMADDYVLKSTFTKLYRWSVKNNHTKEIHSHGGFRTASEAKEFMENNIKHGECWERHTYYKIEE